MLQFNTAQELTTYFEQNPFSTLSEWGYQSLTPQLQQQYRKLVSEGHCFCDCIIIPNTPFDKKLAKQICREYPKNAAKQIIEWGCSYILNAGEYWFDRDLYFLLDDAGKAEYRKAFPDADYHRKHPQYEILLKNLPNRCRAEVREYLPECYTMKQMIEQGDVSYNDESKEAVSFWTVAVKKYPKIVSRDITNMQKWILEDNGWELEFTPQYAEIFKPLNLQLTISQ